MAKRTAHRCVEACPVCQHVCDACMLVMHLFFAGNLNVAVVFPCSRVRPLRVRDALGWTTWLSMIS